MELFEEHDKLFKAGLMPYVVNEQGEPEFLFMIPSDPKFGGDRPNIAKGNIDPGETPIEAAVREAGEELGLVRSNMMSTPALGWQGTIRGLDDTYHLTVFYVEVKSKDNFTTPHYETKSTHWLTQKQFDVEGRPAHKDIVKWINNVCQKKF